MSLAFVTLNQDTVSEEVTLIKGFTQWPVDSDWLLLLDQGLHLDPEQKALLLNDIKTLTPGIYTLKCLYQDALRHESRLCHRDFLEQYRTASWHELQAGVMLRSTLDSDQPMPRKTEQELLAGQNAHPNDPVWSFYLGLHYFETQNDAKAYKLFKAKSASEDKHFYITLSKLYYLKLLWEMKQHDKTLETLNQFFENTLELEFLPALWVLRGVMSKYFGHLGLAKECFQKAYDLSFHEDFHAMNRLVFKADFTWKPLVGLGEVYLDESLFTQAFHSFSKANEFLPGHPMIQTYYVKAGFFIQAYEHILPYLKPGLVQLPEAQIKGLRYICRSESSDELPELILPLIKSINISQPEPFLCSLLIELGIHLLKAQETALAQKIFLKLTKVIPQEALLWHNLGYSYFSQKEYAKALSAYSEAVQVNPGYIPSWFDLGKVHVMQGDTPAAIDSFRHILKLDPQHPQAQQALNQIEDTFEHFAPESTPMEIPLPPPSQEMPFVFVFPLAPTWENGADIALKTYFETFLPEDQVILVFPESGPLLEESETWAQNHFEENTLPPVMVLQDPLPMIPQKSALLFPYRVPPSQEVLDALKDMPYPVVATHAPVHNNHSLPLVWHTEDKEESRRVWSEVNPKALQAILRLSAAGELSTAEDEKVQYHTHHLYEMPSKEAPSQWTLPSGKDAEAKAAQISVCMIVKNEANFLTQCLDSVVPEVEEVILVDTGSTDETKTIAEGYDKVKVLDFEWQNDFAQARNFALKQATQPWVLSLDGDEYLSQDFIPTLKHYLGQDLSAYDALVFPVVALDKEGQEMPQETLPVPRVFRNDSAYQYVGRIHEMLKHQDRSEMNYLYLSQLPIYHQGYQAEVKVERRKHERDTQLMEAMLKEEPDLPESARLYQILAGQYAAQGQLETALEWAQKGLQNTTHDPRIQDSLKHYRWELMLLLQQANQVVKEISHEDNAGASTLFLLGQAFSQQGLLEQACGAWEKTLIALDKTALEPDPLNLNVQEIQVLELLAQNAYQAGKTNQSVYYLRRLLKRQPTHSRAKALLQEFASV